MLVRESVWVVHVLDLMTTRLLDVGLLHRKHHRLQRWLPSAPVDRGLLAHVVAENLILIEELDELRLFDVLVDLVRREVRRVHDLA